MRLTLVLLVLYWMDWVKIISADGAFVCVARSAVATAFMMTESNGNISSLLVTGEFPSQRPVTRSFDVFFHLCLNKRLSKQSSGWWFETPSCSLWRHCKVKFVKWLRFMFYLRENLEDLSSINFDWQYKIQINVYVPSKLVIAYRVKAIWWQSFFGC